MNDVILTSIVGVGTAAASSFVTYLTTRRKYNTEINNLKTQTDRVEIENYKSMLEFYDQLLADNKKRLDAMIEENNQLREAAKLLREELVRCNAKLQEKEIKLKEHERYSNKSDTSSN